jgi:hypothetical protein
VEIGCGTSCRRPLRIQCVPSHRVARTAA